MKASIYILSFLLLLSSCTKFGKNIFVSGRVINPVTNKGIPNIEVELLKISKTISLSSGFKGVKSVYTDENGRFEINHLGGTKSYTVAVRTPASFYQLGWVTESGYNTQDLGVKIGKRINVDYHAVPYGNLIIHAQNINCQGPSDTLQLFLDGSTIGFDDIQIGMLSENYGCINLTGASVQFPMGYRYYHWNIIRGGVTTTVYDTIFIQPNQTNTLEILY